MAMGIFAVDDLGGIDVMWRIRQEYKHLEKPGLRQPIVSERLYEMGRLGQKTGKPAGIATTKRRKPITDPGIEALIDVTPVPPEFHAGHSAQKKSSNAASTSMINEGARILEEGYALARRRH